MIQTLKYYTHCVKSVQIRSYFWSVFSSNTGIYGPEITPYLDTFQTVTRTKSFEDFLKHLFHTGKIVDVLNLDF